MADIERLIKRGLVRTALEILQSEMSKKAVSRVAGDTPDSFLANDSVEVSLDIPYVNRNGIPLAMDIFKPVVPEGTELPVIVLVHGGGLVIGDRTMSRHLANHLAERGYLTFSVEYRTAPRATICEQLDDVCAGMDQVGRKIVDYDVDFGRIFMIAESAGALLAAYVAAMKRSKKLQKAIGYKPSRMVFKAIGLISGMFYTTWPDFIGTVLSDQFYGDKKEDKYFMSLMNPENPEILENLPPVFLITSKGDMLRNYTLMYYEALKKARRPVRLMDFDSNNLRHAFVALQPELQESREAIDEMLTWFENKSDEQRRTEMKELSKEQQELNRKIQDGSIIDQKAWKFIRELNSVSEDRLNALAIVDGERTYTYRQFFRKWDRYAEAFAGLGLTRANKSRVALIGEAVTEVVTSFYALNMTGASVSLLCPMSLFKGESWMKTLKVENITDLLISSFYLNPSSLRKILSKKEEYGIRNVIVLPVRVSGPCTNYMERSYAEKNEKALREVKGAVFFDDCLLKYEATPVSVSEDIDEAAAIAHTSGTTKGVAKPVPFSDRALNAGALHFLQSDIFVPVKQNSVSGMYMDLSGAYGLFDQLHVPLSIGCELVMTCHAMFSPLAAGALIRPYGINLWFTSPLELTFLAMSPNNGSRDFSSLDFVFSGGSYLSPEKRKQGNQILREAGCGAGICNGYGNTEVGGACLISPEDCETDSIGYPLPGVQVLIRDEDDGRFYTLDDGPRTGVMYIASDSLSSGILDGEVLFELTDIEGTKYLCTFDKVIVNEDKSLTYAGRENRYFVNNEGVRFDAGIVETAVSSQNRIESCAVVPMYSKTIHDSIPLLVVKTNCRAEESPDAVKKALVQVYIADGKIDQTALVNKVLITKSIPYNTNGKVDVYKITNKQVGGTMYNVIPIREAGVITDLELRESADDFEYTDSLPDNLDRELFFGTDVNGNNRTPSDGNGPLPPSPFPAYIPPVGPMPMPMPMNFEKSYHPDGTGGNASLPFSPVPPQMPFMSGPAPFPWTCAPFIPNGAGACAGGWSDHNNYYADRSTDSRKEKENTNMRNTTPYGFPEYPFMQSPFFPGPGFWRSPFERNPEQEMPKNPEVRSASFSAGTNPDPRVFETGPKSEPYPRTGPCPWPVAGYPGSTPMLLPPFVMMLLPFLTPPQWGGGPGCVGAPGWYPWSEFKTGPECNREQDYDSRPKHGHECSFGTRPERDGGQPFDSRPECGRRPDRQEWSGPDHGIQPPPPMGFPFMYGFPWMVPGPGINPEPIMKTKAERDPKPAAGPDRQPPQDRPDMPGRPGFPGGPEMPFMPPMPRWSEAPWMPPVPRWPEAPWMW